jgi:DNA-binding beta-propeller fold protein YncE
MRDGVSPKHYLSLPAHTIARPRPHTARGPCSIVGECIGDFASTGRDMRPIFRGDSGDPAILTVGVMMIKEAGENIRLWRELDSKMRRKPMKRLKLPFATVLIILLTLSPSVLHATNPAPLTQIGSTPLPEVTGGDFDHFAVDLRHNRLYVAAEVYASIEVFDLKTGKHLLSARGVVKSPRKIVFLADHNQLLVADAGNASCEFLDGTNLKLINSVALDPGPDAGVYDPQTRIFYVSNGGRAAKTDFSYISMISVDKHRVIGRIRVEAATLKTLVIDPKTEKLYVTMRDKNQVGIVNLEKKAIEQAWSSPELHVDSAMAYDPVHKRIFVGDRNPGKLVVMDAGDGKVIETLDIGNVSDDMTYDSAHQRIYISSADGVDVVRQDSPDHYHVIQHVDTLGGKTSIYVPSIGRFFVVHTKGDLANEAGLQVFNVN